MLEVTKGITLDFGANKQIQELVNHIVLCCLDFMTYMDLNEN